MTEDFDSLRASISSDPVWGDRARSLLDALEGTGLDLRQDDESLLDAMVASRKSYPLVEQFLECMPGLNLNENPKLRTDKSKAVDQLGYLTIQYRRALIEAV